MIISFLIRIFAAQYQFVLLYPYDITTLLNPNIENK